MKCFSLTSNSDSTKGLFEADILCSAITKEQLTFMYKNSSFLEKPKCTTLAFETWLCSTFLTILWRFMPLIKFPGESLIWTESLKWNKTIWSKTIWNKWGNVFKNSPRKNCGIHPLKVENDMVFCFLKYSAWN